MLGAETMLSNPEFLNLDLEIILSEPLTMLADYLDERAVLLLHETVDGLHHVSAEVACGGNDLTPQLAAQKMLTMIDSLPADQELLFTSATKRVFDFGVQGGCITGPYRAELRSEILDETHEKNIDMKITLYS